MKSLKPQVAPAENKLSRIVPGSWRTSDQSAASRGYGHAWRKARERFLLANPLCAMCTAEGTVRQATVVDHKIPHRGDKALFWDSSNWQSLCDKHHSSDKQKEENAKFSMGGGE
ncbi:HNH endonuclease domain protein [Oxalobacter formigenes OXCC13]|uniref:Putative HNH nuclease YajD n=1 Tax=Oxalobacter formigenes OXCC13 TaxID=556269 RepID=C3X7W4_OXAFO|nr:HNH endonuclease domain protein [Oxalobacter formigenes OXCC13]